MGDPRAPLAQVADMLAQLYFRDADIERVVRASGLEPSMMQWDLRPVNTWASVVREADMSGSLPRLLDVILKSYPTHPGLLAARADTLVAVPDAPAPAWRAIDADTREKIIGSNDLVPVWFLERAQQLSRAVGLIRLPGSAGTGFLVAPDLVLTNNHVLPAADHARGATFVLDFQLTRAGNDAASRAIRFAPERGFATSVEADWSLVRLVEPPGAEWGVIDVAPRAIAAGAAVYIIQHPGGSHKHIALGDNRVTYADEHIVQYVTDTLPGSSGSPVFDQQLRLVALHHSGGFLREPGSKNVAYCNEGIAIGEVHAGIASSGLWP